MNTRVFTIVSSAAALALVAGCTAVYKNSVACEDTMRSAAAAQAASQTFKISHTGAGIHGTRVVVEATFESMVPASSVVPLTVAWATPASGASQPSAPPMPSAASAVSASSAAAEALAASAPSVSAAESQASVSVPPSAPTGMPGVLPPSFASAPAEADADVVKPKTAAKVASTKPVRLAIPAAMECRFDGLNLTSSRWLTPGRFVSHTNTDAAQSPD